jgi:putative drug exporter of the RND superfamily
LKILMDDTQALQAVVVNTYGPAHLQSTQTDQTFFDLVNVGNDFDKSRSDDYAVSGPVLVGSRRITA